MPAVKIFAFLDLAQNCSFLNQKQKLKNRKPQYLFSKTENTQLPWE
jgi:hypothetical protein